MSRSALLIALLGTAGSVRAAPIDSTARADALFRSAKTLRAAGKYPEACAAFAESKRLAPGIGVSLYLADCYEHVGKSASAWGEFREAEKLARDRNDKRADVAGGRANALEPRLSHIGVATPAGLTPGSEVRVDDRGILAAPTWTAVAVDPGDHEVTLRVSGRTVRTARARVAAGRWTIVRLDDPTPALPPTSPSPRSDGAVHAETTVSTRQVLGYSLLAAGVAGVAIGTGLLVVKNESLSTGAPDGPATVNHGAAVGSDVAFAVGGAALISAVILYLAAPTQKDSAVVVAPGPLMGGAGAFLSARF